MGEKRRRARFKFQPVLYGRHFNRKGRAEGRRAAFDVPACGCAELEDCHRFFFRRLREGSCRTEEKARDQCDSCCDRSMCSQQLIFISRRSRQSHIPARCRRFFPVWIQFSQYGTGKKTEVITFESCVKPYRTIRKCLRWPWNRSSSIIKKPLGTSGGGTHWQRFAYRKANRSKMRYAGLS